VTGKIHVAFEGCCPKKIKKPKNFTDKVVKEEKKDVAIA